MKPKISVIIPVYNTAPYLIKCLDSVVNQTLKEIEIIIVDDGSDDGSETICDKYAISDNRVFVLHSEHRGVSHARNIGLSHSNGKYIMFVDSDDWVSADFCLIPFQIAENNKADIVIFSYTIIDDEQRFDNVLDIDCGLIEKQTVFSNLHYKDGLGINNYLVTKLFNRCLFDNVFFLEGHNYEDVGVFFRLVHNANNIYYSNAILYNRFRRRGSIVYTNSLQNRNDFLLMYYTKLVHLKKWGYEYNVPFDVFLKALRYLTYMGYNGKLSRECYAIVNSYKEEGFSNLETKTLRFLCTNNRVLFNFVCVLFDKRRNLDRYI